MRIHRTSLLPLAGLGALRLDSNVDDAEFPIFDGRIHTVESASPHRVRWVDDDKTIVVEKAEGECGCDRCRLNMPLPNEAAQ